jgi:hypothetical protein
MTAVRDNARAWGPIALQRTKHRLADCEIALEDAADRDDREAGIRSLQSLLNNAGAAQALGWDCGECVLRILYRVHPIR